MMGVIVHSNFSVASFRMTLFPPRSPTLQSWTPDCHVSYGDVLSDDPFQDMRNNALSCTLPVIPLVGGGRPSGKRIKQNTEFPTEWFLIPSSLPVSTRMPMTNMTGAVKMDGLMWARAQWECQQLCSLDEQTAKGSLRT
jgi:hypothetical protein